MIFDLDGTLVDTADDLAVSMNHALEVMGFAPVERRAVRHLVGRGGRAMLARGIEISAGRPTQKSEIETGLTAFLEHYAGHIAIHSRPFAGAVELIERLRARGAKTAICTNKRERLSRLLIESLGIAAHFDAIVGADTTAAAKPEPAPVRACMDKCAADRGIFVGDSDTDILAARAAGLACLIADFGYGPLAMRKDAAARFSGYDAVEDLIDRALKA